MVEENVVDTIDAQSLLDPYIVAPDLAQADSEADFQVAKSRPRVALPVSVTRPRVSGAAMSSAAPSRRGGKAAGAAVAPSTPALTLPVHQSEVPPATITLQLMPADSEMDSVPLHTTTQSTGAPAPSGQSGVSHSQSPPPYKRKKKSARALQADAPDTATQSVAQRKPSFNEDELNLLVQYVSDHDAEMLSTSGSRITPARRQAHWQAIADRISNLGIMRRTATECYKRWHDLKRRAKSKLASSHAASLVTGGGSPAEDIELTVHEDVAGSYITEEQIQGVGELPDYEALSEDDAHDAEELGEMVLTQEESLPRPGTSGGRGVLVSEHPLVLQTIISRGVSGCTSPELYSCVDSDDAHEDSQVGAPGGYSVRSDPPATGVQPAMGMSVLVEEPGVGTDAGPHSATSDPVPGPADQRGNADLQPQAVPTQQGAVHLAPERCGVRQRGGRQPPGNTIWEQSIYGMANQQAASSEMIAQAVDRVATSIVPPERQMELIQQATDSICHSVREDMLASNRDRQAALDNLRDSIALDGQGQREARREESSHLRQTLVDLEASTVTRTELLLERLTRTLAAEMQATRAEVQATRAEVRATRTVLHGDLRNIYLQNEAFHSRMVAAMEDQTRALRGLPPIAPPPPPVAAPEVEESDSTTDSPTNE